MNSENNLIDLNSSLGLDRSIYPIPESHAVIGNTDLIYLMDESDSMSCDAFEHINQNVLGLDEGWEETSNLNPEDIAVSNRYGSRNVKGWGKSADGARTYTSFRNGQRVVGEGAEAMRMFMTDNQGKRKMASINSSSSASMNKENATHEGHDLPTKRRRRNQNDGFNTKLPSPSGLIPTSTFGLSSVTGTASSLGGSSNTKIMFNANNMLNIPAHHATEDIMTNCANSIGEQLCWNFRISAPY
jgi:hypothetical protein